MMSVLLCLFPIFTVRNSSISFSTCYFLWCSGRTESRDEDVASSCPEPTEWTGYRGFIHEIDKNRRFTRFSRFQSHTSNRKCRSSAWDDSTLPFFRFIVSYELRHRCCSFLLKGRCDMYDQGDGFALRGYVRPSKGLVVYRVSHLNRNFPGSCGLTSLGW